MWLLLYGEAEILSLSCNSDLHLILRNITLFVLVQFTVHKNKTLITLFKTLYHYILVYFSLTQKAKQQEVYIHALKEQFT